MGSNGRNRAVFVASGIFSFCFIIAILYVSTDRQPKSVLNALGSSEEYASNHVNIYCLLIRLHHIVFLLSGTSSGPISGHCS
mmetsp:Transcript_8786/g.25550  ORF Transcript_8786/g.25550 Transcript_8786/m.25550 type:complete len:82 (-) Transcript_8786:281-526(-)